MDLKIYLFIISSLFFTNSIFAQNPYQIRGSVFDTSKATEINKASIVVLHKKDSILVNFCWSKPDGSFAIEKLAAGQYILLISYPDHADYITPFEVSPTTPLLNFGQINLTSKVTLLEQVIIKGRLPGLKIIGDTLEYNTKSLIIAPNAKVEDLLKQIPGIQVDQNGKITAYGQSVNKVLIEGEEFFSSDPTLVTKNIKGDMVAKIQIFDKKSDQATFTGIDDGVKNKTINIKLKEDKKKGLFGKIEIAKSLSRYHQQQAILNIFRDKKKFAIYGNLGNTGKIELSNAENDKYGISNLNIDLFQGGIIKSLSSKNVEFASDRYDGQGIPVARTGGVHYDQKWNSDKEKININYKIGTLDIAGQKDITAKINLNGTALSNRSNQTFDNDVFRQKLDLTYQIKLDTSAAIKISFDGTVKTINSKNTSMISTVIDDQNLLNSGSSTVSNDGKQNTFNTSALYSKKFKKPRRTISLQLNQSSNLNTTEGFLSSVTDFFSKNLRDSSQTIDQFRTYKQNSQIFSGAVNYTEPLSKSTALIWNYAAGLNSSFSNRQTYSEQGSNANRTIDERYSNDFNFDELVNRLGTSLQYQKNNREIRMSLWASKINFTQLDKLSDISYKRNFINLSPAVSYFLNIPEKGWFTVSYLGYATQPTIEQIQPIQVLEDPVNLIIGNPSLKSSFTNRFNLNYLISKPLSGASITIDGFFYSTGQPIINDFNTDLAGKTIFSYINLTSRNTNDFGLSGIFTKKIKKPDLNVSAELKINGNINYSLSNNELIRRNTTIYAAKLNGFKLKPNKYSIELSIRPSYIQSRSSNDFVLDNSGLVLHGDANLAIYLAKKITFNANANYLYQAKTASFARVNKVLLVNTSITKKFFGQENLKLSISVNDVFNQNKGFRRNTVGATVSESNYTTIKRYLLFALSWDFSKFGTTKLEN